MSIGMSREAAEAALRQATGAYSDAAAEQQSLGTHAAATAVQSDAKRSEEDSEETHEIDKAAQDSLLAAGDPAIVGRSPESSMAYQLPDADRVSATVRALLDFGVPIHRLAAVIVAHPTALVADPGADWKPKASCPSHMCPRQ